MGIAFWTRYGFRTNPVLGRWTRRPFSRRSDRLSETVDESIGLAAYLWIEHELRMVVRWDAKEVARGFENEARAFKVGPDLVWINAVQPIDYRARVAGLSPGFTAR